MSIFSKSALAAATSVTQAVDLDARPELWVPDALADDFQRVATDRRDSITPATHPNWVAQLRGDDEISLSGKPLGILRAHLRAALAYLRYDGIIPGTITPPNTQRLKRVPLPTATGPSKLFEQLEPMMPSDEDVARARRYHYSEDHRDEFNALLESTVLDVLSDYKRMWDAYVHITLVDYTLADREQRRADKKRADDRRRMLLCPVCDEENGHIASRALLPDYDPIRYNNGTVPMLRSCIPCWHKGTELELARREQLADGRTRAEAVAAHLNAQAQTHN